MNSLGVRRLRMVDRSHLPSNQRDDALMTLIEHLDELRSRIIKVGLAFFAASIAAWFFRLQILERLLEPSGLDTLQALSPTEQLMTHVKLCLYTGFMLTIPVLIYQAWAFVAPAVEATGRAFTHILIGMSSTLFLAGAAFGYYVVMPIGLNFLIEWDPEHFDPEITSGYYLAFVTRQLLAFEAVFELPAVAYVGAKLGLLDAPFLKRHRRHATAVSAVLAAALTPSRDVVSMILMAVPIVVLYETSIVITHYVYPVSDVSVRSFGTASQGYKGGRTANTRRED